MGILLSGARVIDGSANESLNSIWWQRCRHVMRAKYVPAVTGEYNAAFARGWPSFCLATMNKSEVYKLYIFTVM